ncbi:MAG TPA: radical SAM protein, partial [Usitatibacter sp.]|nr:radical SAM protein [Usitatibacter sp.]
EEALRLAQDIVDMGVPYAAFGGGEPLGVPHACELFEVLAAGGTGIKLETEGSYIDDATADRLAELRMQCIQVSVDGATAATHERVRPGGSFESAVAALERCARRGLEPQMVFAPTRANLAEMNEAYDLAASLGCSTFVTGPLMRLGRAARNWATVAPAAADWEAAAGRLRAHAAARGMPAALSIYPWDILAEVRTRLASPQAMLLVVPNGKVKLLNALPFAPADLRRDSLEQAWRAYCRAWRSDEVRAFVERCELEPELLLHANETWDGAFGGSEHLGTK